MRLAAALCVTMLAVAAPRVAAAAAVLITVDKSAQTMRVEVDGRPVWTWSVSTGTTDGHQTPSGTFHALWLDAKHASSQYENAPMPHSVFFTKFGHAIHGSDAVGHLGRPASHGCVRLTRENAKALYKLVESQKSETTIVVQGEEPTTAKSKLPGRKQLASTPLRGRQTRQDDGAATDDAYEVRYYRDRMDPGGY